jgi:hypothetical protein
VKLGGSVGGSQSVSFPGIHEHTPAISHSSPVSKSLQNEYVRGEYPVQHPSSSYVGDGVTGDAVGHAVAVGGAGASVGGCSSHSDGSLVTIHSHDAAASQALLLSSIPEQKVFVDGVDP